MAPPSSRAMSCLTTSATRRSRSVPAAVLIASAAASSHEVLLVPMISVTLYTLIAISLDHVAPAPGLLRPACHRPIRPAIPQEASDTQTSDTPKASDTPGRRAVQRCRRLICPELSGQRI